MTSIVKSYIITTANIMPFIDCHHPNEVILWKLNYLDNYSILLVLKKTNN